MSLVEVQRGFMFHGEPEAQKIPTGKAAWRSAIYLPGVFSAGIEEWLSGTIITPEIHHNQVMLVLEGKADIKERKESRKYTVEKGDVAVLKAGAKLTITPLIPLKCFFVTVPPHEETPTEILPAEN